MINLLKAIEQVQETLHDHGQGRYMGETSRAQRWEAEYYLDRLTDFVNMQQSGTERLIQIMEKFNLPLSDSDTTTLDRLLTALEEGLTSHYKQGSF